MNELNAHWANGDEGIPLNSHIANPDVILIGSGVMSSHLGVLLKLLDPRLVIQVYEVTAGLAEESSDGWNNAGTGHAGICELSYTPHQLADGTVPVDKALDIFEQFECSRQFWSFATRMGILNHPRDFLNALPHISFVHGDQQVDFLKRRFAAMSKHHFFKQMRFTVDRATIERWAPLLVAGRDNTPIAATSMGDGTDVNFGDLSRKLLRWLARQENCAIATENRVTDLRKSDGGWELAIKDLKTGETRPNTGKFVFVGAGGGSLSLLQKSGIEESKGLGGFPIGGQWLVCTNPKIVARHHSKVYGQALETAPTMAVPHLDSRILGGEKKLLFGPFAAWTTKFLQREGSWTDLPSSVKPDNLLTLCRIGVSNLDLIRYLVQQGIQSMDDRLATLRMFYPAAAAEDWKLIDAGIRVQAIKKTDGEAGIVHYGTEIIASKDRSLSALMGASPGASVCVSIALELIKTCLPHLVSVGEGAERLKKIVPNYGLDLQRSENASLFEKLHRNAGEALGLSTEFEDPASLNLRTA
ncbi:malate dehydrogenase (quinone) [soil metagenome]